MVVVTSGIRRGNSLFIIQRHGGDLFRKEGDAENFFMRGQLQIIL